MIQLITKIMLIKLFNLKKIALSSLLFALFLLPLPAFADVAISDWRENITLTASGKISEVFVQGKIINIPQNQVMTALSIISDKNRKIKIMQVLCDNQASNFSFDNNVLVVNFPQDKPNNSSVSIYFAYEEKYSKINEYLRQETINIPDFAANAKAEVVINFPGYLESATLNPNVVKKGNSFIYRNIVSPNGVQETIKLTPAKSIWDVNVKVKISADKSLGNITITSPIYFQNAGQKVDYLVTQSNVPSIEKSANSNNTIFKFNSPAKEIIIENKAKISTGTINRAPIIRDPNNYLKYTRDEFVLLLPILEQIKQNSEYRDLPLYAKIGRFVHKFIKYDIGYTGKLPNVQQILQNPTGVCTEYARLYNSLARIAGIPSIIIEGSACGEYNKCEGHAWNMIYNNGLWIAVDPTWDLMSGIVSSSHIYFSDEGKDSVMAQYLDSTIKLDSKMSFEMKNATMP